MKKKSISDKIEDAFDHISLGFVAIAGIALVLLRSKLARRFKKRYGGSDEYDNFSGSGSSNDDVCCGSNSSSDKR
jgi:hypothetical protein